MIPYRITDPSDIYLGTCRVGECPRCNHLISVTNRRPGLGSVFPVIDSVPGGYGVRDIELRRATFDMVVRYAIEGTGARRDAAPAAAAAAPAEAAAAAAAPAPAEAAAAGNGQGQGQGQRPEDRRHRGEDAFLGFLAHTPSPTWIPIEVSEDFPGGRLLPSLVRWGILTEVKERGWIRRTKVRNTYYAMSPERQEMLRNSLPLTNFGPDNPRAEANAATFRRVTTDLLGRSDLVRPEDMESTVHLWTSTITLFASSMTCLLRLKPLYSIRLCHQAMTMLFQSLSIVPGRRGPPLRTWQNVVVAITNGCAWWLVVRGLTKLVHSVLSYGIAAALTVAIGGSIASRRPVPRWALDVALIKVHRHTEDYFSVWVYIWVCIGWYVVLDKKRDDIPYWVYGVLLIERFVGMTMWPIVLNGISSLLVALMGGPGLAAS